jgi:hypothetical protein
MSLYSNVEKRKRIRKIEKGAKQVFRRHLIYSYGGGRSGNRIIDPPVSGKWTDCSGFALWLCAKANLPIKNGAGSTISLAQEGSPGTSAWFTLFIKNNPGGDEHIILRLRRKYLITRKIFGEHRWVECGGSDNPQTGEGPAFFHPTASRIAEFNIHRHFKVL